MLLFHLIIFVEFGIHDICHRQALLCDGDFNDGLHRGIAMQPLAQHRELK